MIKTVCVCGAGTMGSGIAQVAAMAGFKTILCEMNPAVLDKARDAIEKNLAVAIEKKKISAEENENTLQRLLFTTEQAACMADLVIEAIIEKTGAKVSLFNELMAINGSETIFASNTSSLSITSIAEKIKFPQQLAGLHFFNPAPIMKLVEVVRTSYTEETLIAELVDFTKQCGKAPVVCSDSPGFTVNRVARPYYIESLRIAEEGEAGYETIDAVLEATGFRMGPFKLMDLIGNDINYAVSCSVYEQLQKPERLKPSIIQKDKVKKGELGKKTGKGYYSY
jgi:3-hydroxybutyryl-CoA dehydrogenase